MFFPNPSPTPSHVSWQSEFSGSRFAPIPARQRSQIHQEPHTWPQNSGHDTQFPCPSPMHPKLNLMQTNSHLIHPDPHPMHPDNYLIPIAHHRPHWLSLHFMYPKASSQAPHCLPMHHATHSCSLDLTLLPQPPPHSTYRFALPANMNSDFLCTQRVTWGHPSPAVCMAGLGVRVT